MEILLKSNNCQIKSIIQLVFHNVLYACSGTTIYMRKGQQDKKKTPGWDFPCLFHFVCCGLVVYTVGHIVGPVSKME